MTVDLTTCEPKPISIANCVMAKDYSVSSQKSVGNGALECL